MEREAILYHLTWVEMKQEWQIHSTALSTIPIFQKKKEAWQATKTLARKARGIAIAYHKKGTLQETCNYTQRRGLRERQADEARRFKEYVREHELECRPTDRSFSHRVWCKTHNCWRVECPKAT